MGFIDSAGPRALLVVVVVWIVACGGKRPDGVFIAQPYAPTADAGPLETEPIPDVPYAASATENFDRAEALLRAHKLDDARALFVVVARRFSFSRHAPLAELRVADIDFVRRDYAKAAREYGAWAHNHPSHGRAPSAIQRAAAAQCRAADVGPCEDDYDAGI